MNSRKKAFYTEITVCVGIFIFLLAWMVIQPFSVSPDEHMKYQIIEYLVEYGVLPHGGDEAIRHEIWGISYAFNPILSSMLSVPFVKVTSFFTASRTDLIIAARLVNVLLGTATAFLSLRIGRRLFKDGAKWLFTALVMLLPGTLFLFSYVNNDGLALFSTALIILMWVRALQEGWDLKTCIGLAIGISICMLSYYNAYGVVLCSVIFFVMTVIKGQRKMDWQFLLKRGTIITGIVLLLAGWWFVRSYIIYDGDFLGMRTSSQYAEMYAQESFKPSQRWVFARTGMSIWKMLLYVPGEWQHNWLGTVLVSFVGTFGYLTEFMPSILSKIYISFFGVGMAGSLLTIKSDFLTLNKDLIYEKTKPVGREHIIVKMMRKRSEWNKTVIFNWCMLGTIIIPVGLLLYYAYYNEFQAQGRYLMPGIIAIMYFVTCGYNNLLDKLIKSEKMRSRLYLAATVMVVIGALYTYVAVFAPLYIR